MGLFSFLRGLFAPHAAHVDILSEPVPSRVDPLFGALQGGGEEWCARMPLDSSGATVEVCIQIYTPPEDLDKAFELARQQYQALIAAKADLKATIIEKICEFFSATGEKLDIDVGRLSLPALDTAPIPDAVRITCDPIELEGIVIGIESLHQKPSLCLSYTGIVINHWFHFNVEDGKLIDFEMDG